MSTQVQLRRGTAAQHATFVGAPGEITVDTTNNTLRVHDGITPGGHPLTLQSLFDAHLAETVSSGVHGMGRIASQDYEVGTWSPNPQALTNVSSIGTVPYAKYVKIGDVVNFWFEVTSVGQDASGITAITFDLPMSRNQNRVTGEAIKLSQARDSSSYVTLYSGVNNILAMAGIRTSDQSTANWLIGGQYSIN